jgi:hypothetical protein
MARCLTKLNSSDKQAMLDQSLLFSDFADDLDSYYRNGTPAPTIDSLVKEINENILPSFISGTYGLDDLKETLEDPENSRAIETAFSKLLQDKRNLNLKANLPNEDYTKKRNYSLVDGLIKDIETKQVQNIASVTEKVIEASKLDEAVPLDKISATLSNYIHEQDYANKRAYRLDRFKGSSSAENITISKFTNDAFLKTAFIDVDKRILVNQVQTPGEISDIDRNIKAYRTNLLKSLIDKLGIPITYSDKLLKTAKFNETLRSIADAVSIVKYNGQQVSLDDPGILFEITEEYKRTQNPQLKQIIDNFSDYVILSDFNKLFDHYGEGAIVVNRFNDDFDPILRKYETKEALSVDAINASWDEKIQNGVELTAPFYKTVINNTPILNYTTGVETGKNLYPTLVSSTIAPYFDLIDRNNQTESLKSIISDRLRATGVGRTEKNVLYTLYKKFFEREGDKPVIELKADGTPKKNLNNSVASFYETIKNSQDQSLMLLITKPMAEVAPVTITEAVELPNGEVKLNIAQAKSKSSVSFTSSRFIQDHINMSQEDLFGTDSNKGFLKKWNIQFLHEAGKESIIKYTGENGIHYELKATDNKVVDIDTIQKLSKDLLGFDFINDKRHAEFWEEVQSYANNDEDMAPIYLTYLKDALNIVEAKTKLYDTDFQKMLFDQRRESLTNGSKISTGYKVIDDAITSDNRFPFSDSSKYKFKLNNLNAKIIDNLITTVENNYTGNQLKSVTPTVEGTTSAAYSNYNYSLGITQNLTSHRRFLNSVARPDIEKSPLYNNLVVNDPNFLQGFTIRGASRVTSVVKSVTSQTAGETIHYDINLGFFSRIKEGLEGAPTKPIFNILIPSDKSLHPLPTFNNEVLIPSIGRIKLFIDDNGFAPSHERSMNLLYQTNGHYYRAYGQNIIDTWGAIYRASGHGSIFDSQINLKGTLSDKLTALNEFHKGDSGFWKTGTFEHGLKDLNAARFYADKAGVVLTNWIHYISNTKSFGPNTRLEIKSDLIKNISHYDSNPDIPSVSFKKKYNDQLLNYANDLRNINFKFDQSARETITKLYPKLSGEFGNKADMYITSSNSEAAIDNIHPAIIKYFWDHNLLAENLMNSSAGTIYGHKGDNENTMWLTQIKRNVNFTATIRNYTLGLENGVEDTTRTAFVDDLTSMSKGILGDKDPIVDFDGASFETMTQRMKTWNSLNAKFNGNGGTVHKSFISHYDPTTGLFGETKHAAFTLTNELIRQSQGTNMDLMELHKQLYATNISKIDITKSWKDGVNLTSFNDVYYYDRKIDFETGLMGTLYKLDSIRHVSMNEDGKSQYEVTTRNLTTEQTKPMVITRPIETMFDLWHVLGGIDSVEHTDLETQLHYNPTGNNKFYLTGNHKSHEKLLDYENYIGNKGETIIPEAYIDGGGKNSVRNGYKAYKDIFDTNGVVNSHLNLIKKWVNVDFSKAEAHNMLITELKGYAIKGNHMNFISAIKTNQDNLSDLIEFTENNYFQLVKRPYQRFKGKNIDRISFAGAQKVGQFNMNNIETIHNGKRLDFLQGNKIDNDPGIPGVTKLITYQISNFNAGIQLSAWHSTDNTVVTTPTQMLNALIFNAKSLGKVQHMYKAIGNIVDQELTYMMDKAQYNIPSLVRALNTQDPSGKLGPKEWYEQNKDKLLGIFHNIMQNKVAKDEKDEFTLESLIVNMFNHKDMPFDDPQIFHSAVAELTNYITKTGIRTKFDGLFAVLHPASEFMQLHDVKGGFLPVKNELGGYDKLKLEPNEIRTLQPFEYSEYKRLNEHLLNHYDLEIRTHASTHQTLNEQPRNLKGQQVILRYKDGSTQELSTSEEDGEHLIPEARALDLVKSKIDDYKDQLKDDPYKKLSDSDKITTLKAKHKAFLIELDDLKAIQEKGKLKHPEIAHVLDNFTQELQNTLKLGIEVKDPYKFAYENFSQSKQYRDNKIADLERDKTKQGVEALRVAKEHEYFDKLNTVGMLYTGRLQKFMDETNNGYIDSQGSVSYIPQSLQNSELFKNANKLEGSKVEISRAECIAPIVAKTNFMLQEGDTIGSITKELIHKRLINTLDYFKVDADGILISKSGKKIFLHKGEQTSDIKVNEHPNIALFNGKKWFTNDSKDRLFQVPNDMSVNNINGNLHVFLNGKYNMDDNPLIQNLNLGFGKQNDKFTLSGFLGEKNRELLYQQELGKLEAKAQQVYSSWQVYIDSVIGSRVPGQHFQSFQGMKIVGFSQDNNIHVSNSVIKLSGADYDIDKQNIIYHSIDNNGVLTGWHPTFDYSSKESLLESLKLPMPSNRTQSDFISELSPTGEPIDKEMNLGENLDLTNPHVLNGIYSLLDKGYRLNSEKHVNIIQKLVEYEQTSVALDGIKNFAVASTNQIIESPSNYLYLSNGVNTNTIKQFSSRTEKAKIANEGRKENPVAQARQKYENMIGKQGISIMASQMKVLSANQYTTNSTLKEVSDLYDKQKRYEEIRENYLYHLDTIHDVNKHYSGPHTQEQLEEGVRKVNRRIDNIKENISDLTQNIVDGGDNLTLPNINYDLLSNHFETQSTIKTLTGNVEISNLHRTSNNKLIDDNKHLSWAKIASNFDPDLADLDSQLLSSATDNAKELDLGKINAIPEVMTVYPSMGLTNQPFEKVVDNMTSPIVGMLLRNATKNIYDKTTGNNSIGDLLTNVKLASSNIESDFKSQAIEKLYNIYKLQHYGTGFADINTRNYYSTDELLGFRDSIFKPAQVATLLAGYLSINQGIKTNSWDLYNFANRLQDNINGMYMVGQHPTDFNFKQFLDSVDSNGNYHKAVTNDTSRYFQELGINFNPLYVLTNNPHYTKQLSAFNSANTILRESSYRVNSMYHIVDKLRDMGYISATGNIKQQDFNEVEKFVEATIINSFIASERRNNSNNNDEKPIFNIHGNIINLDNANDRKTFINWIQTDFLRDISENSALKGNAFTQDLRRDSKQDPLLFDKVDFMKLQMDTTNVKTNVEQGPFRDAYVAGLKEVYDRKYTDLNDNNIFNALFWYNLILNKNNITKNSYAKLLGDVMWQDNMDPNVYSRLFELKGKVGKSSIAELNIGSKPRIYTDESDKVGTVNDRFFKLNIAGIPFDLRNLFLNYEVGNIKILPAIREDGLEQQYDEGQAYDADNFDNTVTGEIDDGAEVESDYGDSVGGDMGDIFDNDTENTAKIQRNYMEINRTKQSGIPGTRVAIKINKDVIVTPVIESTTTMPLQSDNPTISDDINYNPFVKKDVELRSDQSEAFNYYKLATGNIHDLLSRLSDATDIQITHNGITEKFDKSKNYDC